MTKMVSIQGQQRWDCCYETRKTETSLIIALNELGQQGWELVDVLYYKDMKGAMAWTAFLKRPSVGQSSASGQLATAAAKPTPSAPTDDKTDSSRGFDLSGEEFQLKTE